MMSTSRPTSTSGQCLDMAALPTLATGPGRMVLPPTGPGHMGLPMTETTLGTRGLRNTATDLGPGLHTAATSLGTSGPWDTVTGRILLTRTTTQRGSIAGIRGLVKW